MWVIFLGFAVLISCFLLLVFLVQYASTQNKNDHKTFASYKNSMIGSNLSKIQTSLQTVNQSTVKYLESSQVSKFKQLTNHLFGNTFNYIINIFKFFWNLRPINNQQDVTSLPQLREEKIKEDVTSPSDEDFIPESNSNISNSSNQVASPKPVYKRNIVNPKQDNNLSIEDAKIKTHSTLIIGQESDDDELLEDLNKKNDSLIDHSNTEMSKDDLFKLEKFTLNRFNQARGYNKLDIALDLAEIYGKLNQLDLQKELYLWVLNKTSNDDIRHRVVNKLIAN